MSKKWLVGDGLTIADICIFAILLKATDLESYNKYPSISKWCERITALNPIRDTCTNLLKLKLPANWIINLNKGPGNKPKKNQPSVPQKKDAKKGESGTFEQLPGAEMGKVCKCPFLTSKLQYRYSLCKVLEFLVRYMNV